MVAMPAFIAACGLANVAGSPSHSTRPASGRWTPARTLISVDLPAPFWPSRQCTSPARTSSATPSSARTPGKVFTTSVKRRVGEADRAGEYAAEPGGGVANELDAGQVPFGGALRDVPGRHRAGAGEPLGERRGGARTRGRGRLAGQGGPTEQRLQAPDV